MSLINEKVEHIKFGAGTITEAEKDMIKVNFNEPVGTKAFQYPEVFEIFLKAVKPSVENSVLEDLHKKQALIEQESESKRKENEAAELLEQEVKAALTKGKSAAKPRKKKSLI